MKLRTESGSDCELLTQDPGLGSGTLEVRTGNHADELVTCSLNLPLNTSWIDSSENVHIADPDNPLLEVENTA